MAKRFKSLQPDHSTFMAQQQIFYVASAAADSHVNISPRPTDWLRVIDDKTVAYLDKTGSGNETAAHILAGGRVTMMFCAFEGPPLILRLYGSGRVCRARSAAYAGLLSAHFGGTAPPGARQIVVLQVALVQSSCGYGVPRFSYAGARDGLDRWAAAKGEAGIAAYWREKNAVSLDGLPTGLAPDTPA